MMFRFVVAKWMLRRAFIQVQSVRQPSEDVSDVSDVDMVDPRGTSHPYFHVFSVRKRVFYFSSHCAGTSKESSVLLFLLGFSAGNPPTDGPPQPTAAGVEGILQELKVEERSVCSLLRVPRSGLEPRGVGAMT